MVQVPTRYTELDSNLILGVFVYRTVRKYALMFLNHSVCSVYLFLFMFIYATYICVGASGGQKTIKCPEAMWILGLELGSSWRAASALND